MEKIHYVYSTGKYERLYSAEALLKLRNEGGFKR